MTALLLGVEICPPCPEQLRFTPGRAMGSRGCPPLPTLKLSFDVTCSIEAR